MTFLLAALLALAGCGGNDESSGSKDETAMKEDEAAVKEDEAAMKEDEAAMKATATITVGDSEFGSMLFDSRKQAIYIFQRDKNGQSACYGECAKAWPPVLTKAKPRARHGVKPSLLGTAKRRDGKLQVTYAGKPLYFYAHESAGEVRCHNVNLNGGFWWVIGPGGNRRA
jgi:predicted lipoprotein with Yx(FWY)xxD motif